MFQIGKVTRPLLRHEQVASDGFEWWSESDGALGEELQFVLSTWASLTAVLLQFPTGDTYLFDLRLYTAADGAREPFATLTVSLHNVKIRLAHVLYFVDAIDLTQDPVT